MPRANSYILFFCLLCFSCKNEGGKGFETDEVIDNVKLSLTNLSQYDSLEKNKRKKNLYMFIEAIENDSLKNEAYSVSALYFLQNDDSLNFVETNKRSIFLSKNLSDTLKLAESYWDLAYFFELHGDYEESFFNYSKAERLYDLKGKNFYSGRMLLRMAIIQKNIKDYTGSEISTIKAIKIFEPLNKYAYLYGCYNNLGIIFNELEEYSKALIYHRKAKEYQEELGNVSFYKEKTLNNIGVIYRNLGNYPDAINNFKKALLNPSLADDDPHLYAMLLDNLAYAKMLAKDTSGIYPYFLKGLKIREQIQHNAGVAVNKLHLAEFFALKGDSIESQKLAKESYIISKESGNNKEVLQSLLLLSKLNRYRSEEFLGKYISLNDSLQKEERATRNKFARIRFETDEFIAENNELNFQRRWIIFGFSGLILLVILGFANRHQRQKNRELKLIQMQQQSNEEIYNLLIDSQTKIEEAQEKEQKRISRELHDGILSQFFGVRLNLEFLNDGTDRNSIEKRNVYINELKVLEKDIRKVSHELNVDFLSSEKSFLNIVAELLNNQVGNTNFKSELVVEDQIKWENLTPKSKINLYRIIQEAIHNIQKYANAKNVKLSFVQSVNELKVIIEDDGKGFEMELVKDGIGIKNMRMRTNDLKGSIAFKSNKNGTRIEINLPKKKNERNNKNINGG